MGIGSTLDVTGGMGVTGAVTLRNNLTVNSAATIGGTTTIIGNLLFSSGTFGGTGTTVPALNFIGQANSPITLSVLADNSISFDGSSGQLFSINNNLSSGTIFAVNDITGLPLIRVNANGTVSMGEFGGNIGIGLSLPAYKLHVIGDANLGIGSAYRINGTSVITSTTVLGLTVNNGIITGGTWQGSAIGLTYGGTGLGSSGAANQILGMSNASTGLEYKTFAAGSGIAVLRSAQAVGW